MVFVLKIRPFAGRVISSFVSQRDRLFVQIVVGDSMYRSSYSETGGGFPSWRDEIVFEFPMEKRIKLFVCTDMYIIGEGEIVTEKAFDSPQFEEIVPLLNGEKSNAGELRVAVELAKVARDFPVSRAVLRRAQTMAERTANSQTFSRPSPL